MKPFLVATCIIHCALLQAQPYQQGVRNINFVDEARGNRVIPATLYYPANTNGTDVPLAGGTEKFPAVVFGHGFTIQPAAYKWLADSLVKYGFLVALPGTETGFSPSHEQFGRDLAFLCRRILSLNDSASSFLAGRVEQKSAVGGHSMGGGCSFLAMGYNTAINAIFNFAAAETNPSAYNAATAVQKPALVYSGSADCIVRDTVQQRLYNNIPYTCKTYINITGGLHCHFSNNDVTCVTGQVLSGCNTSAITAATVFDKASYLLVPFLQHYLKSNCSAKTEFGARYAAITGVTKQQTCTADPQSPCTVTAITGIANGGGIRLHGNPVTGGQLVVTASKTIRQLLLYDRLGRLSASTTAAAYRVQWPLTGLPPGWYLLECRLTGGTRLQKPILVQR